MPERSERVLKLITYGLGIILLLQFVRVGLRCNPLGHVTIPAVPVLSVTDSTAEGKTTTATNAPAATEPARKEGTVGRDNSKIKGTNSVAVQPLTGQSSNGAAANFKTNNLALAQAKPQSLGTNRASLATATTNSTMSSNLSRTVSNSVAQIPHAGTNGVASGGPGGRGTNAAARPGIGRMGQPGMPGPGMPPPDLPPAVQARVDRIVESEIFAPVMRPLPMALLGIAGNVAFLRAPNGQTGVIKENEEVGGVKLLRIGTNRVLVEEEGQKKELTIFSGLGGDSLLPKKETP